jgi:serine/threonine protein kinase
LVLADIVDALATVHRAGKLHRDIKPGNVLVTDDHHGFLVDFGLVYETGAEGITLGDKVVGTPSYMAPEQIRTERRDLTAAVDIWGIGVLLYQLLTGRLSFDGDTPYEIFDHIIGLRPQPPSALAAGLPEDLNRGGRHLPRQRPGPALRVG